MDIVERLREDAKYAPRDGWPSVLDLMANDCLSAADEIDKLRAQLEVAKAAMDAAISKASWQAVTNVELNALAEENNRLRAGMTPNVQAQGGDDGFIVGDSPAAAGSACFGD